MLKIRPSIILLFVSLFFLNAAHSQNEYHLNLGEAKQNVVPTHYYIQSVIDRRKDPSVNGKVLASWGKALDVKFAGKPELEIYNYIYHSITTDSSYVPIQVVIEKLSFSDRGSVSSHTLSLEVKISAVRIIEGKEFVLYVTNGAPSYKSTGVSPGLAEKLLRQVLDSFISGFNEYANSNKEQQAFCKRAIAKFVYDDSYSNYKNADTIRWKQDYKLKWEDFEGNADPSSSFSAQSNCMFSYKASVDYKSGEMTLSLLIYPCFTKKASWVIRENKQDGLLKHEQLHFDICELYIRRLRKQISALELNLLDPGAQIRIAFERAWSDYQVAQSLYDEESRHGLILDAQEKWETQVKKNLDELEEFMTPS
jgi:hypothetical protein